MIYSSPYPYFRSGIQFTPADATGAAVIQHDLLEQSLKHGVCEAAELFLEWAPIEFSQQSKVAIKRLSTIFGDSAIRLSCLSALQDADRIGVVKNLDMALSVLSARAALGLNRFPVSLITHSLVTFNTGHLLSALCLATEPGDAIIATSTAAFSEIIRAVPTATLLLAGASQTNAYIHELDTLGVELGLGKRVQMIANFPPPMKRILLGAADILVSPVDNIQETFGISVLEAMASGLPVIASNWSGYRDIVRHGVTGFLIPTYTFWDRLEAIHRCAAHPDTAATERAYASLTVIDNAELLRCVIMLAHNPNLRTEFGNAGRRRALQEFSWAQVIKQYGSVWRQQLDQSRSGKEPKERRICDIKALFESFPSSPEQYDKRLYVSKAGLHFLEHSRYNEGDITQILWPAPIFRIQIILS